MDVAAPLGTLADALATLGSRRFVLSDGAAAVLVQDIASRERVAVAPIAPGAASSVRSVNGAGDALAGATLARWLDGRSLAAAVREAGLPAARDILLGRRGAASPRVP